MIKTRVLALGCFCLILLSCATIPKEGPRPDVTVSPLYNPNIHNRLAVFVTDQTRQFSKTGALRSVEDEFMKAVIGKGYTLVARSDIEQIAKELKFQQSQLTEKQFAQIGRLLNVSAALIVSINSVNTENISHLCKYKDKITIKQQRVLVHVS